MDRRTSLPLILALSGLPLAGAAQQRRLFRIAFLTSKPISPEGSFRTGFRAGMRELGWIEDRDFTMENLHYDGRSERLPELAATVVERRFDLILCAGRLPAVAAMHATTAIPVVFFYVDDPVGAGLASTFSRPGGNLTGLGGLWTGISGKMLELLNEAAPAATRIALLTDSTLAQQAEFETEARAVARKVWLKLTTIQLRSPDGLDDTFAAIDRDKPDALLIWGQPFLFVQAARLAKLAIERSLPTIIPFEEVAQEGVLMSYGARLSDEAQRLPYYVDRILRGSSPATIPVEQPSRFYLTLNLKTAKSIGLTFPPSLLQRAHRLIE